MGVSSFILKLLAKQEYKKNVLMQASAIKDQNSILRTILKRGNNCLFTQNLNLSNNLTYHQYANCVPISDYESIRPYIKKISNGEKNILYTYEKGVLNGPTKIFSKEGELLEEGNYKNGQQITN